MADGPSVTFGGPAGEMLGSIVVFLKDGGEPVRLIISAILGVVVSPFVATIKFVRSIGIFVSAPFREFGQTVTAIANAAFQGPANLILAGAEISESALRGIVGETLAGIFALPISVGVAGLSLLLVIRVLQQRETGDTIIGVPIDLPDIFGAQIGVAEEGEEDDA